MTTGHTAVIPSPYVDEGAQSPSDIRITTEVTSTSKQPRAPLDILVSERFIDGFAESDFQIGPVNLAQYQLEGVDNDRQITLADDPKTTSRLSNVPSSTSSGRILTESGSYERIRLLGSGGMGNVFSCRTTDSGRVVAIKESEAFRSPEYAKRFIREIQTMQYLNHPNIIDILDCDLDKRLIVMEQLDGTPLDKIEVPNSEEEVANLVRRIIPIGQALDYMHDSGIVHRDVKPANIIYNEDDSILIDMGLVSYNDECSQEVKGKIPRILQERITQTGTALGTPVTMAPEQMRASEAVTGKADVYALSATLYRSLTGTFPIVGDSALDLMQNVLDENNIPVNPQRYNKSVRLSLGAVIKKGLRKDPSKRPDMPGLIGYLQKAIDRY